MKTVKLSFKKSIAFLLWIIVASGPSYGFEKTFTFDLSDFTLNNQDGTLSILPNNRAYSFDYNQPGFPNIPFFRIVIPTNNPCDISTLRYEVISSRIIATNFRVQLKEPYVIMGKKTQEQEEIMEAEYGLYPDSLIRLYNGPALFDNRIVLAIAPYVYNKAEKSLSFINQIRVHYDELPVPEKTDKSANDRSVNNQYDYLIITQDSLAETFKELRNWKTAKGVKTEIVTLDSIAKFCNNCPISLVNADSIKKYIHACYQYNNISMVLLGGTFPLVPAQTCRIEYKGDVQSVLSDMYYACLDGDWTWNANNNGIIGEISGDGVNLTPTLSVSRLPIETNAQLSSYIQKLLNYEKNPQRNGYLSHLLLSGNIAHWNSNGQSDAQIESEAMYIDYIEPFYSNLSKHFFYDTGNDLDRTGVDSNMNASNLSCIINDYRPHYFNMFCHGEITQWITPGIYYTPIFTTADASTLENDGTPMVITTVACQTSDFSHSYPCLAESFLRHPTGGAIAYWGSSHNGIGTPDANSDELSPSLQMCGEFWKKLSSDYRFGDAVMKAKEEKLDYAYNSNYPYNWLLKSMNALGDCELPIYTEEPLDFTGTKIIIDYTDITVENHDTEEDFQIAIVSKDNGATAFNVVESTASGESFSDGYDVCSICLTKQNYVPLYVETGRFVCSNGNLSLYLQNQDFKGNYFYFGAQDEIQDINIGSHVDNENENGDVIIEPDATANFYCANRVKIQSGFKCKKGGKLSINISDI